MNENECCRWGEEESDPPDCLTLMSPECGQGPTIVATASEMTEILCYRYCPYCGKKLEIEP